MNNQNTNAAEFVRQHPRGGLESPAETSNNLSSKSKGLSARLNLIFRKLRHGTPIERHEIAELLPYTEPSNGTGVAA